MGKGSGPRPNAIVNERRREVQLRLHVGMAAKEISEQLGYPYKTISRDIREIKKWQGKSTDQQALDVRRFAVLEMWGEIQRIRDLIALEYKEANLGFTEKVFKVPSGKEGNVDKVLRQMMEELGKGSMTPEELEKHRETIKQKLQLVSEKVTTLRPRLAAISSLFRAEAEYWKLILNAFDFGTPKVSVHDESKNLIVGKAIITQKAHKDDWQKMADKYGQQGQEIEVVTSDD